MDEFSLVELDEIMRQKEDLNFTELLCRVRKASCINEDLNTLKARVAHDISPDYPEVSPCLSAQQRCG